MTRKFDDDAYRDAWLETYVKHSLAGQMRALRGNDRQEDFGRKIGASQSQVARQENPAYGSMTVNTLLSIAKKLRIAVQIRFVPFSRVMDDLRDDSADDLAPLPYEQDMEQRKSVRNGPVLVTKTQNTMKLVDATGGNWPRGRFPPIRRTERNIDLSQITNGIQARNET